MFKSKRSVSTAGNTYTTITHYWAVNTHADRWQVLQKARSSSGTNYSISGGTNGLRVVTTDEAESINRTGKLPTAADSGR